ncbi:DedA family protein [Allokutzneria albata]|uniref:Membrane-associated protein n=1 Tax=Allokutzneria albata TaxID=211114 RepID=A0A1G9ZPR0_ALLAB|nr:VTT domain-containing protein [Allokutzneria albata]SDN22613.1 membrane-associated protein [Allokutzneria albata]
MALFGIKWLDPEYIISSMGHFALVGICLIVFAECGLFAFFLPGDSLLFVAGLFVAHGTIETPIWLVCVLITLAGILGNAVGYAIGWKAGPALFDKPNSKIFKKDYVDKTHEFFEKYGSRAIVLSRFVPVVRTFITALAGVGRMDPKKYFTYSIIGGIAWGAGVTLLGFFLGEIPFIKNNLEAAILGIVFLSIIPIIIEVIKARKEKKIAAREAAEQTQVFQTFRD